MKKILSFVVFLFAISIFADLKINSLEYSSDNGKTWSEDMPILQGNNRKFMLKVNWSGQEDPKKVIWNGLVTASLISEDKDFASAFNGKRKYGTVFGYIQPASKANWFPSQKPFLFSVDLGERKEGTMGKNNKWTGKSFAPAPLSCLPAHDPGNYRFRVVVTYRWIKPRPEGKYEKDKRLVEEIETFDVLLKK